MKTSRLFLTVVGVILTFSTINAQSVRNERAQFFIQFDDRPDQVTWELRSSDLFGNITPRITESGGPYPRSFANKLVRILTNSRGRKELTVRDSGGNGIKNGAFAINTRSGGDERTVTREETIIGRRLANVNTDFGAVTRVIFRVIAEGIEVDSAPGTIGNVTLSDFDLGGVPASPGQIIPATVAPNPNPRPRPTPRPVLRGGITSFTQNSTGPNSVNINITNTSNAPIQARLIFVNITTGRQVISRELITINSGENSIPFEGVEGNIYVARLRLRGNSRPLRLRFGL